MTLLRILNKKVYHFEQHVGNFEIFLVVQCYVINVPTCIFLPVRLEVMLNSINFKLFSLPEAIEDISDVIFGVGTPIRTSSLIGGY